MKHARPLRNTHGRGAPARRKAKRRAQIPARWEVRRGTPRVARPPARLRGYPIPALSVSPDRASKVSDPPQLAVNNARRQSKAQAIVNRYAAYSAIGGLVPLALANFAGITTIILRMVKVLCKHYGVPFERDRTRAIVIGLVGGAMPTGAAAITTTTLLYMTPPTAVLGLAVSGVTAAVFTRSIGRIFIEHLESGAALDALSAQRV